MKTNSFNIEEIVHSISNALYPDKTEGLVYREELSNSTGFASTKKKIMMVYKVKDNKSELIISYNYVVSPKYEEENKQHELFFIGTLVKIIT